MEELDKLKHEIHKIIISLGLIAIVAEVMYIIAVTYQAPLTIRIHIGIVIVGNLFAAWVLILIRRHFISAVVYTALLVISSVVLNNLLAMVK